MDLNNLLWLLFLVSQFGGFFKLKSLLVLVLLHVGIEDHPLGCLNREDRSLRRVSLDTALTEW